MDKKQLNIGKQMCYPPKTQQPGKKREKFYGIKNFSVVNVRVTCSEPNRPNNTPPSNPGLSVVAI